MDALHVDHLNVRLGQTQVLEDLAFDLPQGALLAVIGPNGAGKTVLFRALAGALPHGGVIRWAAGTRVGYVPQKLDLERDLPLSGADLLHARAGIARLPRRAVAEVADRVGLSDELIARPIGALSGGQFHLLLFAFALIGEPNVLLLDEPTAGVDELGHGRLYELLSTLRAERGTTVLLISHELSVVTRQATHVLCLGRRRACFGAPHDVITPETLSQIYGAPVSFHVHDHA
jgi:zinc transport system ATP-binding protein